MLSLSRPQSWRKGLPLLLLTVALTLSACQVVAPPTGGGGPTTTSQTLVIYSGRSESLVGPIIQQFEEATGIDVAVRWGGTSEVAATLMEEGNATPADIFYAQDPGALGALKPVLAELPEDILALVPEGFRDADGRWVGISARVRVVVYNTDALTPEDLPADIWDFVDPRWSGKIGYPPTNASFHVMVTAMRTIWGEEKTRAWLEGLLANQPVAYDNNTAVVQAVGAGEVEVGFVNHYYLYRFLAEQGESFPARNHFLTGGGPGSLVMVSGVGIPAASDNKEAAERFIRFMLSRVAQQYFASQTYEYPLVEGVTTQPGLTPLNELNSIDIDLANLADLEGTLALLSEVGVLP